MMSKWTPPHDRLWRVKLLFDIEAEKAEGFKGWIVARLGALTNGGGYQPLSVAVTHQYDVQVELLYRGVQFTAQDVLSLVVGRLLADCPYPESSRYILLASVHQARKAQDIYAERRSALFPGLL